jgi:hypothetical protein
LTLDSAGFSAITHLKPRISVIRVPLHQKKSVADTKMTMHSRAVLMIKTDFITVKVALGAQAKNVIVLLLRNASIKNKDG